MNVLSSCVYICHVHAWCPWASDPMELELQMVVRHLVGAGN